MICKRCGFGCPHVEAGGIHGCPNCGDPVPSSNGVKYKFGFGCDVCNLPGHTPLDGYMKPYPRSHPMVAFGLAPAAEDIIEDVMES